MPEIAWNNIDIRVPEPERKLIAMRSESDDVERFRFGKHYHISSPSWEVAIKEAFRNKAVTHWVYTSAIAP